jgi:large subunit ribosomal protein L10
VLSTFRESKPREVKGPRPRTGFSFPTCVQRGTKATKGGESLKKQEKLEVVKKLKQQLKENQVLLLADYRGLTVAEMSDLRRELKSAGVQFTVIKNRLLIKALEGSTIESLSEYLRGPAAAAFHVDDPVTPARILANFANENEKLGIKGGAVEGDVLDADAVLRLSRLPGRVELRSGIAGQINSLLGTVTTSIDALLQELAGLVEARSKALDETA